MTMVLTVLKSGFWSESSSVDHLFRWELNCACASLLIKPNGSSKPALSTWGSRHCVNIIFTNQRLFSLSSSASLVSVPWGKEFTCVSVSFSTHLGSQFDDLLTVPLGPIVALRFRLDTGHLWIETQFKIRVCLRDTLFPHILIYSRQYILMSAVNNSYVQFETSLRANLN